MERKNPLWPENFSQAVLGQAYRDALNYTSRMAFENGKMSNQVKLQKLVYLDIRSRFGLPSQMACNAPRQVGAAYKTLWARAKGNAEHRRQGFTKRRYRGLDKPPVFSAPTVTFSYGRDYRFKTDQQVSITTLEGPVVLSYAGYSKHLDLIRAGSQEGVAFGAAKLWRDPRTKVFYLLVSLEVEHPDPDPTAFVGVKGVDLGERYLAVTATPVGQSQFFPGGSVRHKGEGFQRVRSRLQAKGTRGAKRRLRRLTLRERRFKADVNHRIAKAIVEPGCLIGLEELKDIREGTRVKGKKARRRRSKWAFAEMGAFIVYKAALAGGFAIKVDADYTSKACPICGYVSDGNRPGKGILFRCQSCGTSLHADLVGARNVTLRTLLVRQDWMGTGFLSASPDGSNDEAKAGRLQRFLELRWSSDPSSGL